MEGELGSFGPRGSSPARRPKAPKTDLVDPPGLVERLRARDAKAYEEVLRTYGGRMRALARRLVRNDSDADDCLQEACIKAFRNIDRFEGRSALWSWLRPIVVNEALMLLRSRRNHPEEDIEPMLPSFRDDGHRAHESPLCSESLESLVQREELSAIVRRGIDALPEGHRTVILLRDIEGFSTEEVARLLDTNENAVKARLHRARAALKRMLESTLYGEPRAVDYEALRRELQVKDR